MTDDAPAIEAVGLRKEFGAKVAVDSLDLTVARGEVFGFLGPNGAGKTTFIKMLLGLVHPTAGRGRMMGVDIGDPRARRGVGFLPEHFRFHEWLRADEFLALHARLHGIPRSTGDQKVGELLELVGLTDASTRRLGTFSKGMLQRVGLAQALINDPRLVFLDEPTSGLDPLGRRMVREVVHRISQEGTTVFLNSHYLSEVEVTCTRVAFVAAGRVREVTSLRGPLNGSVRVEVRLGRLDEALLEGLRRWGQQVQANHETNTVTLSLADEGQLPQLARWLVEHGAELYSLTPRPLTLEEQFMSIVGNGVPCETS